MYFLSEKISILDHFFHVLTGETVDAYKDFTIAFVPFLPLEKRHIRQCIKDFLLRYRYFRRRNNIPEYIIEEISNKLNYFPDDTKRFSMTGCRRIPEIVAYLMTED